MTEKRKKRGRPKGSKNRPKKPKPTEAPNTMEMEKLKGDFILRSFATFPLFTGFCFIYHALNEISTNLKEIKKQGEKTE